MIGKVEQYLLNEIKKKGTTRFLPAFWSKCFERAGEP